MYQEIIQNLKSGLLRLSPLQLAFIAALMTIELRLKFVLEQRLEAWSGSVPVFPGFNLTLGHNRGVSFGILDSSYWIAPYLLSSFAIILVVFVLSWAARQSAKLINVAGILFAAGGLANAIDRLGDGAVTDYLDFGWQATRWPTFNLADVLIFVGVALLLFGWRAGTANAKGGG